IAPGHAPVVQPGVDMQTSSHSQPGRQFGGNQRLRKPPEVEQPVSTNRPPARASEAQRVRSIARFLFAGGDVGLAAAKARRQDHAPGSKLEQIRSGKKPRDSRAAAEPAKVVTLLRLATGLPKRLGNCSSPLTPVEAVSG